MNRLLPASVALLTACTGHMPSPAASSIVRLDNTTITSDSMTVQLASIVARARIQGLTVAIFNDAQPVYRHAFGSANLPANQPLHTSTEFYGASLSKSVFAVIVMRLVERGLLDLDTPLQQYVKEPLWTNTGAAWHDDLRDLTGDPRLGRVTARMCLDHSTGLPNWRFFEPDRKLRFHFEPGARYSYSGEGMVLLQIVLQKITGRSLEQLAQEEVFGPYGMTMSSYSWQPRFESDFAVGHKADGSTYEKDKDNAPRAPSTLETTPDDLTRFLGAVLRGDGLQRASWATMFTPQIRIRGRHQFGPGALDTTTANDAIQLSYGLGWGLLKTPHGWAAFKEGHGDGFQHYMVIFPDRKLGVLLMSNSDNTEAVFDQLLETTIADSYTPLEWEGYGRFVQ